jgi:hypothetical protein
MLPSAALAELSSTRKLPPAGGVQARNVRLATSETARVGPSAVCVCATALVCVLTTFRV